MVSGREFGLGPHSIASTKPLTVSLQGLNGTLLAARPDTEVEIRSPEIRLGSALSIDGTTLVAGEDGLLSFTLATPGPHTIEARH